MSDDPWPCDRGNGRFWGSRASIALVVLGGIAAWFLLAEHRAHVFGALSYVLVLACPLMHVFMHRRHRHYARGRTASERGAPPSGVGDSP